MDGGQVLNVEQQLTALMIITMLHKRVNSRREVEKEFSMMDFHNVDPVLEEVNKFLEQPTISQYYELFLKAGETDFPRS